MCKQDFVRLGLEQVSLSETHASQDCAICSAPLALHPSDAIKSHSEYHASVRVFACGHILGQECLDAWLDSGNSCPVCNRMLFEFTGDWITQHDVNKIVHDLGLSYGEHRVVAAVARFSDRQKADRARLRNSNETGMARLKAKEVQIKSEEFIITGEDFVDSDNDMDFSEDDDDKNEEGNEDFMYEEQGASDSVE